jgi:hypothetical protein
MIKTMVVTLWSIAAIFIGLALIGAFVPMDSTDGAVPAAVMLIGSFGFSGLACAAGAILLARRTNIANKR